MRTVLDFEGERLVMTHPCQQCGQEIDKGDLCQQCFIDSQMFDDEEDCGQCGGEGYTYDCIDGCCANAEEGCRLCERRCDFCNPFKPTPEQAKEREQLGQILAAALKKPKTE